MRKAFLCVGLSALCLAACGEGKREPVSTDAETGAGAFSFQQQPGKLHLLARGSPFTTLYYGPEWDKPFVYPIRTASGKVISRGYPLETREGEHTDHDWHRGIWFGHGDVNGEDFWRELGPEKTSKLVAKSEPVFSSSGDKGTVSIELNMQTPKKEVLGTVKESYTLSLAGSTAIIDAEIEVAADKGISLKFGDTDDGGFAFRLMDNFRQDQGAILINSEGLKDTENIWGKAARWVDYSATIDGQRIGVAVFDHPSNLRHPTTWHARGYSLCAANPFGLRSFTEDKSKDGSYTIEAGKSLVFRYRIVIHEGELEPAAIDKLFEKYAQVS